MKAKSQSQEPRAKLGTSGSTSRRQGLFGRGLYCTSVAWFLRSPPPLRYGCTPCRIGPCNVSGRPLDSNIDNHLDAQSLAWCGQGRYQKTFHQELVLVDRSGKFRSKTDLHSSIHSQIPPAGPLVSCDCEWTTPGVIETAPSLWVRLSCSHCQDVRHTGSAVHDNGHAITIRICKDRLALRESADDLVADTSHRTHKTIVPRHCCREHLGALHPLAVNDKRLPIASETSETNGES